MVRVSWRPESELTLLITRRILCSLDDYMKKRCLLKPKKSRLGKSFTTLVSWRRVPPFLCEEAQPCFIERKLRSGAQEGARERFIENLLVCLVWSTGYIRSGPRWHVRFQH
jgi:hypothetical protein